MLNAGRGRRRQHLRGARLAVGINATKKAMSAPPAKASSATVTEKIQISREDRGHRLGNFHNYYTFNPPENRIAVLEDLSLINFIAERLLRKDKVAEEKATANAVCSGSGGRGRKRSRSEGAYRAHCLLYCDLGCNEGELTAELASTLLERCRKLQDGANRVAADAETDALATSGGNPGVAMRCLGLDIDPILIERANRKHARSGGAGTDVESSPPFRMESRFEVCNLCDANQHEEACREAILRCADGEEDARKRRFDLTTLFSTTMWIHVHAGDSGLREFLKRVCSKTDMLLVEPQPSKCYRHANVRLRKMERPELDNVSSQSLNMRSNVEREIDEVICQCGFTRVQDCGDNEIGSGSDCHNSGRYTDEATRGRDNSDGRIRAAKRTSWNRALHLYVRDDAS